MSDEFKITMTPEDEALWAFDQANDVEPHRTIAERIASNHGFGWGHPMVDEISHALEDAQDIGRRRAPLEIESARSHEKPATTDRVALGPHPDQPEVEQVTPQTYSVMNNRAASNLENYK